MTSVRVARVADFDRLGRCWRALEQRARPSFFQTWTWIGCLAAARFDDPIAVEAIEGDTVVALALFNRRRHWFSLTTLYLHESGSPGYDCPYIEQNGVLAVAGREAELTALCLGAVVRRHRVVVSGIGPDARTGAQRASGLVRTRREQPSPCVDLAAVRLRGGDFLAGCSANTRQQIRRSDRFFAQRGPITVSLASDISEAEKLLGEMASLHQASWQARGQPGSFARPFFGRFHHALIERGLPRQEIALMRVSHGDRTIGVLYNFVYRRRMLAYQSGFAAYPDVPQAKPGLTCHHAAIRHAAASGLDLYDFLAGGARYKLSLADSAHQQYWIEAGPRWSPGLAAGYLRDRLRETLLRSDRR